MNFISRVMRFLFWLLIVSWSVALLRRIVAWMFREATMPEQASASGEVPGSRAGGPGAESGNAPDGLAARRLVRDPICGVHVAEVLSIPLRAGGEMVHFCSLACRDKYVNSSQRMAANG
jgi:hypothetical protein